MFGAGGCRSWKWRYRAALVVLLAWSGLFLPGCSGEHNPLNSITAVVVSNDSTSTPNQVHLTGEASGDVVVIRVVLGGPTSSDDLYTFAFDLVTDDPGVLDYIEGSATLGDALTLEDGESGVVLAVPFGDRVTVGVSKLGSVSGNGVTVDEVTVVTLQFKVLQNKRVSSLAIDVQDDPVALNSSGKTIDGIRFDDSPVMVSGL